MKTIKRITPFRSIELIKKSLLILENRSLKSTWKPRIKHPVAIIISVDMYNIKVILLIIVAIIL